MIEDTQFYKTVPPPGMIRANNSYFIQRLCASYTAVDGEGASLDRSLYLQAIHHANSYASFSIMVTE